MTIWEELAGLLPVVLTLPKQFTVVRVTKMFSTKSIVTLKFKMLALLEDCVTHTSNLTFPFYEFCVRVSPLESVRSG
jgi:hypothetical protein